MKKIIYVLVVIVIIAGGVYYVLNKDKSETSLEDKSGYTTPNTNPPQTPPSAPSPAPTPSPTPITPPSPTPNPTPVSTPAPITYNVTIQNFSFNQQSITIKKGDSVVWTNMDSAPHTVTGTVGGPNSGTLNTGNNYKFTFSNTGTFNYHCAFHPSMTGVITVTE